MQICADIDPLADPVSDSDLDMQAVMSPGMPGFCLTVVARALASVSVGRYADIFKL